MKLLYLASAAAAALAIGLASAQAQSTDPRSDERPAAGSRQQPQRAQEMDRSRRAAPSEQRSNKSWEQRAAEKEQGRQPGTTGAAPAQTDRRPAASEPAAPQRRTTAPERDRSGAAQPSRSTVSGGGLRPEPRGRAMRERDRSTSDSMSRQDGRSTGQAAQPSAPQRTTRDEPGRAPRAAERETSRSRNPALTEQERSRVTTTFSERIDRMNVRPLSRSSISVSVGASIPRSVRLYDVPADIVRIHPGFRGHKFVVVDDEIVVVAPDRRRIVATLPMSGERQASRAMARSTTGVAPARSTTGVAPARERIRLSPEERTVIRTTVLREPACRLEQRFDFFIGIPLPRTVQVCEFPSEVLAEVPEVRRYRYITRGDEIV